MPKDQDNLATVPVLSLLANYLEHHRNGFPADGYIFAGQEMRPPQTRESRPRLIVPTLNQKGCKIFAGLAWVQLQVQKRRKPT